MNPLVTGGAIVADADSTAPNGEDVAAAHLHTHMRERDAETEVGSHRAFACQQAFQQRLRFQVGKTFHTNRQQFLQRAFKIMAPQINDATAGNDFVETHEVGSLELSGCSLELHVGYEHHEAVTAVSSGYLAPSSISFFPLERALLNLVKKAKHEHADEEQDRSEDRDIVGQKLTVDKSPRHQDHDLEIE